MDKIINNGIIGKTVEEATAFVRRVVKIRVIEQDGVKNMLTGDMRTNRMNVVVENGLITSIDGYY